MYVPTHRDTFGGGFAVNGYGMNQPRDPGFATVRIAAREAIRQVEILAAEIERGVFSADAAALHSMVARERLLRRIRISLFAALGLADLSRAEAERLVEQFDTDLQDLNTEAATLKPAIEDASKVDALHAAVAEVQNAIERAS